MSMSYSSHQGSSAGKWNSNSVKGDVHEGGDGAIEGRLHHDVGFNIRGGGNAIRFHGVMVSRDLLDFSGSHFLMNIFFI